MQLNRFIDHTLLKPDATRAQIKKLCEEAKEYHFASVCVNTAQIAYVAELLSGTDTAPCCVVGFPLGAMVASAKAFEAREAVRLGAKEVDMVINVGAVKEGDFETVESDIKAVLAETSGKALLKVIIEACLLSDDEKVKVCLIAKHAGADFVKTSTGFSTGGATIADVMLMRKTVGIEMGVKASGGIRSMDDAIAMIEAGATRLGTSAGVKLMS